MKAYVMTTGALFGLMVVVHIWRVVEEGPRLVRDPWFILINLVAIVLCLWAVQSLRQVPRP